MMNDGNVMCDGSESHVRHEQGLSSCEPSTKEASARSRPGILIFSRGQQLLHVNSLALELTGHFNQDEIGLVRDLRSAPVQNSVLRSKKRWTTAEKSISGKSLN